MTAISAHSTAHLNGTTSRLNSCLATKKQPRKATKKPPIDHISRVRSSIRCSISGADDVSTSSSGSLTWRWPLSLRRRLRPSAFACRGGLAALQPSPPALAAAVLTAGLPGARRLRAWPRPISRQPPWRAGFGAPPCAVALGSRLARLDRRCALRAPVRRSAAAAAIAGSAGVAFSGGITGGAGMASGPETPAWPAAPFFKGSAAWATGEAGSAGLAAAWRRGRRRRFSESGPDVRRAPSRTD